MAKAKKRRSAIGELMSAADDACLVRSPRDDGKVDFILYLKTPDGLHLYRAERLPYVGGGHKYAFFHAVFRGAGIPGTGELVSFADARMDASRAERAGFTLDVNPRSAVKRELPQVDGIGPFWAGFCDYLREVDGHRR